MFPEDINTADHEDIRPAEQGCEPRCRVAINKEALLGELAREDAPEADHLKQHVLNPMPPPVFIIPHLWILILLLLVQQSPQIKRKRRSCLILAMAYDVIVPPDTAVEHVAYEIVNAIIWSTRTSQLDPGESY